MSPRILEKLLCRNPAVAPLSVYFGGSRNFSSSGSTFTPIKNVTVIGAGTMGAGIAQVAAQAGNNVVLVDTEDSFLKKAQGAMATSLQRIAKKSFKDEPDKAKSLVEATLGRINYTTDKHKSVESADLVIEAIIEKLEIKQELFGLLDKAAPQHTILTSNTSSIPIKEIVANVGRKDKCGGLHFFSPVPMMKLLEVIRIPETSDSTYSAMDSWGKAIGKVTVKCKDTPGFIVNRLLVPYMNEAMKLVERGDASPKDVDTAMKLGAGHPMGPFELSDAVGVDVGYFIALGWEKRFADDPSFKVPKTLEKLVKEGKLGRKTGEGWYKYDKK